MQEGDSTLPKISMIVPQGAVASEARRFLPANKGEVQDNKAELP